MNDEVRDGIYWGALCDECAGALLALDGASLCTFALFCRDHGLVGVVVSN
jgi:hypothetical protein